VPFWRSSGRNAWLVRVVRQFVEGTETVVLAKSTTSRLVESRGPGTGHATPALTPLGRGACGLAAPEFADRQILGNGLDNLATKPSRESQDQVNNGGLTPRWSSATTSSSSRTSPGRTARPSIRRRRRLDCEGQDDGAYGLLLRRPLRWSGRRGSNPQHLAWEASTLPLSYARLMAEFWQNLDWMPRKCLFFLRLGSWHSATELRPPGASYLTTIRAAAISRP
jgi:hypothetical protein